MRRSSPTLLSLALLFAGGYASAAELQHQSAEASANCPDSASTANDRTDLGDVDPATAMAPAMRHSEKSKAAVTPRSSSTTRATAPRWHSFLPGMFR